MNRPAGEKPLLRVLHGGPGVPEAERESIFRRFWRRDRTRPESRGLGLAIAGPRVYHGERVDDHWMNEGGRPHAAAPDIRMALRLFVRACWMQAALLIALIWLFD